MFDLINIISLTTANERREHIRTQFSSLNLSFKFFDAVNKQTLHSVLKQYPLTFTNDSLTDGEKACFLSHYLLWQQLCANSDDYMIICEDDVVLSRQIHDLLIHVPTIMQNCDILKFETMLCPVVLESDGEMLFQEISLKKLKTENMGTAGYIISKNMARHLVEFFNNAEINQPIDHYLFLDFLALDGKIYQTVPAFAIQDDVLNTGKEQLKSDLREDRRNRLNAKQQQTHKLVREFLRLFKPFNAKYRKEKKYRKYIKNHGQIIEFKMD